MRLSSSHHKLNYTKFYKIPSLINDRKIMAHVLRVPPKIFNVSSFSFHKIMISNHDDFCMNHENLAFSTI